MAMLAEAALDPGSYFSLSSPGFSQQSQGGWPGKVSSSSDPTCQKAQLVSPAVVGQSLSV